MFHIYEKVISQDLCDEINKHLVPYLEKDERRHFVASGKKFFFSSMTGLSFLHKVLSEITNKINLRELYKNPYVDHAYLLLKSGGVMQRLRIKIDHSGQIKKMKSQFQ